MSLDISYYRKINNSYNGVSKVSKKESKIYSLKKHIAETFNDSLDFHDDTLRNAISQKFVVSYHTDSNKKKITAYPDDELHIGDMIDCFDLKWLVMELNADKTVFTKGVMQKCNYTLPFQTNSSTIYNEPCIVLTQSEATSGENQGSIITISDTQRVIYVQYNERTKYLIEGRRLFVDQNVDKPKVYKITKVDRICYMDGENGLLKLICDEDTVQDVDNVALKIANYIAPIAPTPQPTPDPTTIYTCKITNTLTPYTEYDSTFKAQIKSGGSKKPFMCHFFDATDNEVTLIPAWSIDVSGLTTAQQSKIELTFDPAYPLRAYLSALNDSTMIGSKFKLILSDNEGLCAPHAIEVEVIALT